MPSGHSRPENGGRGAGPGCCAEMLGQVLLPWGRLPGVLLPCPSEAHKEHGSLSCSYLLQTYLSGASSQAVALLGAPVL